MTIKEKIPVGILGVTGSVGRQFLRLLADHPWFRLTAAGASHRSAGKTIATAVADEGLPEHIATMPIVPCVPGEAMPCRIVFSGLDASVAGDIESDFARAGYIVISNSRNHRYDPDVPLMIPEVNPDHLELITSQNFGAGCIITNPNCSTTGLVLALKPLYDAFGVEAVHVTTLQAVSGAGYPGLPAIDMIDNVLPYIAGEEDKLEREPLKILGDMKNGTINPATITVSAHCTRVPVSDGHLECVSVKLTRTTTEKEIIDCWQNFRAKPQELRLPTAPQQPLHYFADERLPQPRRQRHLGAGMAVSIGRLRPCALLDFKFVVLSHNTVRGAAGGAVLNAELLAAQKQSLF